jgi:hypothetical protein
MSLLLLLFSKTEALPEFILVGIASRKLLRICFDLILAGDLLPVFKSNMLTPKGFLCMACRHDVN